MSLFLLFAFLVTFAYGLIQLYGAHMEYIHDPYRKDHDLAYWSTFTFLSVLLFFSFIATWRWLWT